MRAIQLAPLGLLLGSCSDYEIIKRDVGDVFYQLEAGKVDILLVVDNSPVFEKKGAHTLRPPFYFLVFVWEAGGLVFW